MMRFFIQGGPFMWPLMIFAIVVLALIIKKTMDFFRVQSLTPQKLESGINAILFWGFMSLVLGFYAHFQGVYMAMQAIMQANDISPAIGAEGYRQSLITILFGLITFIVSSFVWFIFRWQFKKTSAAKEYH